MHSTLEAIHAISEKDAARLLVTDSALGQLSFADARRVITYMKPKRIKSGAALIREGEKTHNDFMMLILSGDVRIESQSSGAAEQMIVTVMGAGSLIGEIGLINDTARSATCIAASELAVAVLSRTAFKKLMSDEPDLAARLLLAISSRMAERLRETTSKLKRFMQLNAVLQGEVYRLMDAQAAPSKRLQRSEMPTEPMMLATQPAALMEGYVRSTKPNSLRKTTLKR
jgi:CRP/FNR family transcriptional regulator, cyclic AMP receptor protein